MTTVKGIQLRVTTHAFSIPKRQIPFLSSALRGDIQNYCKFELQSPDDMTIVNKLLYMDSYYLVSMVIFSGVLKQLFSKRLFQNNFSPRITNIDISLSQEQDRYQLRYDTVKVPYFATF